MLSKGTLAEGRWLPLTTLVGASRIYLGPLFFLTTTFCELTRDANTTLSRSEMGVPD